MRPFGLLLATLIAATCFAGCGGCGGRRLEPQPLTADEERQFQEHLDEVEEFERTGGAAPE